MLMSVENNAIQLAIFGESGVSSIAALDTGTVHAPVKIGFDPRSSVPHPPPPFFSVVFTLYSVCVSLSS